MPNSIRRRSALPNLLASLLMTQVAAAASAGAAEAAGTFTNPILRGSYPDPSICRLGEDYYLVNSSFEYVPGLPIHHSKDLVNWRLVGYGLHLPHHYAESVNLVDVQSNGGIHAPSIRCRDDLFYIITTNVYKPAAADAPTQMVNFVITAADPSGPWSAPKIIEGAPGIDPDLFFDDDGRVWYLGTQAPENPDFPGQGEIWLQQLDTAQWRLVGERHLLWRGACGGTWAEGPHLYKRDGRYYLLVAEGGTSFNHAVMVAVSDDIRGPYISNARNPILSSRHLSYDHWVNSTGHSDLLELPDGRWQLVTLGIRGDLERRSNMGRETHLVPVIWQREPFEWKTVRHEWPVAAPATGRVERYASLPFAALPQHRDNSFVDNFDTATLGLEWNFRRAPLPNSYSLTAKPGHLRLYAKPEIIAERGRSSLLGIRQRESDFEYSAKLAFSPRQDGVEAGISLFQKDDNYLNATLMRQAGAHLLKLTLAERDKAHRVLAQQAIAGYRGELILRAASKNQRYRFSFSLDGGASFITLAETAANHILSRGYTGAYLGLYSTSNGQPSTEHADVDWVRSQFFERSGGP